MASFGLFTERTDIEPIFKRFVDTFSVNLISSCVSFSFFLFCIYRKHLTTATRAEQQQKRNIQNVNMMKHTHTHRGRERPMRTYSLCVAMNMWQSLFTAFIHMHQHLSDIPLEKSVHLELFNIWLFLGSDDEKHIKVRLTDIHTANSIGIFIYRQKIIYSWSALMDSGLAFVGFVSFRFV